MSKENSKFNLIQLKHSIPMFSWNKLKINKILEFVSTFSAYQYKTKTEEQKLQFVLQKARKVRAQN